MCNRISSISLNQGFQTSRISFNWLISWKVYFDDKEKHKGEKKRSSDEQITSQITTTNIFHVSLSCRKFGQRPLDRAVLK